MRPIQAVHSIGPRFGVYITLTRPSRTPGSENSLGLAAGALEEVMPPSTARHVLNFHDDTNRLSHLGMALNCDDVTAAKLLEQAIKKVKGSEVGGFGVETTTTLKQAARHLFRIPG